MRRSHRSAAWSTVLLTAMVTAAPIRAQQLIGPAGSQAGQSFLDSCAGAAAGFTVRAGWWVDGIQVHCLSAAGTPAPSFANRGGTGGSASEFRLEPGERITAVSGAHTGNAGPYIYAIQFHTDRRSSPVFGQAGDDRGRETFRLEVPQGAVLRGLQLRAEQYLNAVGLMVSPPLPPATRPKEVAGASALVPVDVPGAQGSGTGGPWCPARGVACRDATTGLSWMSGEGARIPGGGLVIGTEPDGVRGRTLFACRVYFADGSRLAGKTGAGFQGCNVGVGGREVVARSYEVLMSISSEIMGWRPASGGAATPGAVDALRLGEQAVVLCRALHRGGRHPGYVAPGRGCVIGWGEREVVVPAGYEVLVYTGGS